MPAPIIDVHSHPFTDVFVRTVSDRGDNLVDGATLPSWSLDAHVAMMDEKGIGVSLLSQPGLGEKLVGSGGSSKARAINEELARIVAAHPSRFGAFGVVPMDDMDSANTEMAYALDVLKLDGIGITTHCQGRYLGEPCYEPWLEEMNRRGVTLFVHPATPAYYDTKTAVMNPSVLEFMFDTTRMVVTMVLSGAKKKFDRINIISTHGGGTIPYLAHRISIIQLMPWAYKNHKPEDPVDVLASLGSFYYDLTASSVPAALDSIRRLVPVERLLMGFDYPMMPVSTVSPAISALVNNPAVNQAEQRQIIRDNALRLFPRFR